MLVELQTTGFNVMPQTISCLKYFSTDWADNSPCVNMVSLNMGPEVVLLFRGLSADFTDPA